MIELKRKQDELMKTKNNLGYDVLDPSFLEKLLETMTAINLHIKATRLSNEFMTLAHLERDNKDTTEQWRTIKEKQEELNQAILEYETK